MTWRLKDADPALRLFITSFLLVISVGYAVGLVFVDHTTGGSAQGISAEFRGNVSDPGADGASDPGPGPAGDGEGAAELKFGKGPREIYTLLHNHIVSLGILFFCVGAVFYFSSARDGLKQFLIVEPFAAILTTFGGLWLVRFVHPAFSWLVIASGVSMFACLAAMMFLILRELWLRR